MEIGIRRITVCAGRVLREEEVKKAESFEQLDLFTDYATLEQRRKEEHCVNILWTNLQKGIADSVA